MDREKTSGILRIVAGGYLIYLAYNLFKSVSSGQSSNYMLMIAFSVLFVILGGVILYMGIKGMMQQGKFVDGEEFEAEVIEDSEKQIESSKIMEEAAVVETVSPKEAEKIEAASPEEVEKVEAASPEETEKAQSIEK